MGDASDSLIAGDQIESFQKKFDALPRYLQDTLERYCGHGVSAAEIAIEDDIHPQQVYARLDTAEKLLGCPIARLTKRGRRRGHHPAQAI